MDVNNCLKHDVVKRYLQLNAMAGLSLLEALGHEIEFPEKRSLVVRTYCYRKTT